jgi:hypothetical protein
VNTEDLNEQLVSQGIRAESYSLNGRDQDGRYCLERSRGGWAVFFSERGERNHERWFTDEEAACAHLLEVVLTDPTTRGRR